MRVPRTILPIVVAICVVGSGVVMASDEPMVERTGKYRIWYTAPDLRAELEYREANRRLGEEWLLLKLSVAGGRQGVTNISREAVRVRTPDGHTAVLPSQTEFRKVSGSFRVALDRYNAWGPPSSRFGGSLRRLAEWFFAPPGERFDRNIIHPSSFQYCTGPLAFQIPGGVQPGGWMLVIELTESTARIPFVLEEDE